MKIVDIARVCHEINRAYCASLGDHSQPSWEDAPDWQRQSAVTGVEFTIANPDAGPSASHDSWLAEKQRDGWKYGAVKDPVKKEHPCFVPYDQLPPEQKAKDYLFQAVVRSLASSPSEAEASPMLGFLATLHMARTHLDAMAIHPRAKALVMTKLDEARLWAVDGQEA